MPETYPLTVHVPIRGKLLIQLDGTDALHEVGTFEQNVDVVFQPGPGNVEFSFDKKFWEGAIESRKGVEPPTPATEADEQIIGIIEEAVKEQRVFGPEPRYLAGFIYARLSREGVL